MKDENGNEYEECVVGNIICQHHYGTNKEIKSGTKHFSGGTKVYCLFIYGGPGHENIRVLGKKRKSFRMVDLIARADYIKNFRLQKVYSPRVINFINKYDCVADPNEIMNYWVPRHKHVELEDGKNE